MKRMFVGFAATEDERDLVESVRKATREKTASAVLRKALEDYAKAHGVPVPVAV